MAASFQTNLILILLALVLSSSATTAQELDETESLSLGPEKLTRFRLYLHEIFDGSNATVVYAAHGNATNLVFGTVSVLNDIMALGPEADSKVVGRAQALLAIASQTESALTMIMNFVFTDGKFNGSVLTLAGRNNLNLKVREVPIVGGTGAFQFARGYVRTSTVFINQINKTAVAEYNVSVLHY
ncbi:dirigent protein 21-like [Eucalyptus grandis]|uniref:dirigent protein 21-like n=1 Tax=Eucalyptus grandis TaxID=71139 RepID=UPI0008A0E3B0|nr:dirigent protein 21-like [Eucalyptus grandis]XP_039155834.1 dirigent protein 21-like [Eucalyptus grandis]